MDAYPNHSCSRLRHRFQVGGYYQAYHNFVELDDSDFFLPGSSCDLTCSGHTHWDPTSSSTSKDVGQTFTLKYGDNSTVSGEQYTDTVSIAGFTMCFVMLSINTTISDSQVGDHSDSWRCKHILHRIPKFSIPCRRFDGNGFPIYLGLWR